MDKKHRGAHSELIACTWLLQRGFEVFRNISQHGSVDIIAIKDGRVYPIDVKTANSRGNTSKLAVGVIGLKVFPDGRCIWRNSSIHSTMQGAGYWLAHEKFDRDYLKDKKVIRGVVNNAEANYE
jgi:hypothetical protein